MNKLFVSSLTLGVSLAAGGLFAGVVDDDTVIYLDGATTTNHGQSRWTVTTCNFGTETANLVGDTVMGSQTDTAPADNVSSFYRANGGVIQMTDSGEASSSYVFGDFTVEMFFKSANKEKINGTYDTYLAWHTGAWMIQFDSNGAISIKDDGWGSASGKIYSADICDGDWHHVAFVQDRTAGTWSGYVDYRLVGVLNYVVPTSKEPGKLDFNCYAETPQLHHMDSHFDEIRITSRALKPSEFLTTPSLAESFVDVERLTGSDTVVYVSGSVTPSAGVEMNEMCVKGVAKPSLKLTYSRTPVSEPPPDFGRLYLGPACDAEHVANDRMLRFQGPGRMKMTDCSYLQTDFTTEFFFRADDPATVSDGGTESPDAYLIIQNGVYYVRINKDTGYLAVDAFGTSVYPTLPGTSTYANMADGKWHHVAFAWEKATKTLRAYLDYRLVNVQVKSEDIWPSTQTDYAACLYIGAGHWSDGAYHVVKNCCMDEIRITQKRLSPAEFLAPRTYPVFADTYAYYDFNLELKAERGLCFDRDVSVEYRQNVTANIPESKLETSDVVPAASVYARAEGAGATPNEKSFFFDISAYEKGNNTSSGGGYIVMDKSNKITTSSFTAELFFKTDTIPTPYYGYLLCQTHVFQVFLTNGGKLGCWLGSTSTSHVDGDLLTDDKWHHVAAVYDQSAKTFSVYLDYRLFKRYENVEDMLAPGETRPGMLFVGGSSRNGNETSWWSLSGNCTKYWMDDVRLTGHALKVTEFLTLAQLPTASERLWGRFEAASLESGTPAGQYALTAEASGDVVLKLGPQARPSRRIYANASAAATENAYGAYLNGGTLTYRGEGVLDLPTATTEFFVRGTGTGTATVAALTAGAEGWTLTADGHLSVAAGDAADAIALNVSPVDGRWHHVAVVTEVASGETAVCVYVDHALVGSTTLAGRFAFGAPASLVFGSAAFVGGVDEVRVTKAALSTVQLMKCDPPPGILVIVK